MTIDYFDIGEVKPEEKTIEGLSRLAKEASELAAEIADDQIEINKKQLRLDEINRKFIPEIMQSLGMASFKMQDGSEVVVENKLNASISAANKERAFKWLDDHGFGGIIKTKIESFFSREEREDVARAQELLTKAGFSAEVTASIHAGTLKSFVKERLAAAAERSELDHDGFSDAETNDDIPQDLFGVYEFKEAKIKAPKVSKKRK